MGNLLRDPNDTAQVFRIVEELGDRTPKRLTRRLRATPSGSRLLRDKPRLLARLKDRAALAALPRGSVGHAYLDFCAGEGITAEGLVDASERGYSAGRTVLDADEAYVADRMRDSHDLWHVVTGYRGDLIGEASLLAFTFAQTWNRGVGVIVAMALVKAAEPELRKVILGGFARGRKAAWLPSLGWEDLLAAPLSRQRLALGLGAPPRYQEVRAL
jgi:ubiquinone biosynthesis protein COQ4